MQPEAHWQPLARVKRHHLPQHISAWLADTGSLTDRLRKACREELQVIPLRQAWSRPLLSEARVLAAKPHHRALIREVHLVCGPATWVYARSIIPQATLTGRRRRLKRLGSRPLGALLFADPSLRRGPMEVAEIQPRHALFASAAGRLTTLPASIWGRRSVFFLGGRPLLVHEIFLPQLPAWPD